MAMRSLAGFTDAGSSAGERSRFVVVLCGAVAAGALFARWSHSVGRSKPRSSWLYEPGSLTHYLAEVLERHSQRRRRPVRVYLDGCFDMFHYGHANALRQAKACGDVLLVGVVGDAEILANKGPPVFTEEERLVMVESVKWVDVVLKGVPYEVNDAFMRQLFLDHGVDYILHGDDPCLLPDGSDAYAAVKKAGRFKMVKRTEGISTTDLVGRMLMCTTRPASSMVGGPSKMHKTFSRRNGQSHDDLIEEADAAVASLGSGHGATADAPGGSGPASNGVLGGTQGPNTGVSTFCPTSRRIRQFSSGRTPAPGARVVYIDGAFDMFHPGHVDALRASRQYGDFLLCGVHTDEAVSTRRGPHLPILSLHERSLSVLACKYVDEVIIGAPARLTPDLLTTFGVSVVVRGTVHETAPPGGGSGAEDDRYASAREAGMLVIMPSPRALTTGQIIERILANKSRYEERNRKKGKSEQNYLAQKTYVSEA